jgi:hypothetical protein
VSFLLSFSSFILSLQLLALLGKLWARCVSRHVGS